MEAWTEVQALGMKRQAQKHYEERAMGKTMGWTRAGRRDGPKTHSGLALGDWGDVSEIRSYWKTRTSNGKECPLKPQTLLC